MCPTCGKGPFKNQSRLQAHVRGKKNRACYEAYFNIKSKSATHPSPPQARVESPSKRSTDNAFPVGDDSPSPAKTPRRSLNLTPTAETPEKSPAPARILRAKTRKTIISPRKTRRSARIQLKNSALNYPNGDKEDAAPIQEDDDSDSEDEQSTLMNELDAAADDDSSNNNNNLPDESMLHEFEAYCQESYKDRIPMDKDTTAALELLALLSKKRVPLNVYDVVFQWHLSNLGATKFVDQKALVKKLKERYNMEKNQPKKLKNLLLPHSKSRIDLVVHDAKYQIMSLLTDPRIRDEDYLFFNDDPFQGPPPEFEYVSDINTGRSYRETYDLLITDPAKQVLFPVIFYMDGAVTGQFDNLPIEALKMTLGIFNQITRDKAMAWRNIGYVTRFIHERTKAEDILLASEHMDSEFYVKNVDGVDNSPKFEDDPDATHVDETDETGVTANGQPVLEEEEPASSTCAAQDLHFMLGKMLEPYKKLAESGGFRWKLRYKGETHDIHFIPFIMFIKGDSVELDKHCGSYTIRTKNVDQLCRYCTCPMEHTDDPWRRYPRKSQPMIQNLVDADDEEALKGLSQQYILNIWYEYMFGFQNDLGVHGASPLEILHWFQINKYKYDRASLFDQIGDKSALAKEVNALMVSLGFLFARQSDRELPRTSFSKGLRKGKLQGHEMTGLSLITAGLFRTRAGRVAFRVNSKGKQKEFFSEANIKGWVELIELQLMWEAWLNSKELSVSDVEKSEVKIREIMQMEKEMWKREKGMGCKTFNFHGSTHVAEDILDFGVPINVNTSSNEMHHKPDKNAALRTQRRPQSFDMQCGNQIHIFLIILFALEEIQEGRNLWAYFNKAADEPREVTTTTDEEDDLDDNQQEELEPNVTLGGTRVEFVLDGVGKVPKYTVKSKMKDKKKFVFHQDLVLTLADILERLGPDVNELTIYTYHKRHDQIFRGTPYFMGKPWMDWVNVTWEDANGNPYELPCQIWCFLDLRDIPEGLEWEPGIYAVCETASRNRNREETALSRLFEPYKKDIHEDGNYVARVFHVVDVEAFASPACLIPDIGNLDDTALLRLKPRREWAEMFVEWLNKPAKRTVRQME